MSDDAPQFKLLTKDHALCWIHDGRHYKKLNPIIAKFRDDKEQFRGQYWDYYAELFKSDDFDYNSNCQEIGTLSL